VPDPLGPQRGGAPSTQEAFEEPGDEAADLLAQPQPRHPIRQAHPWPIGFPWRCRSAGITIEASPIAGLDRIQHVRDRRQGVQERADLGAVEGGRLDRDSAPRPRDQAVDLLHAALIKQRAELPGQRETRLKAPGIDQGLHRLRPPARPFVPGREHQRVMAQQQHPVRERRLDRRGHSRVGAGEGRADAVLDLRVRVDPRAQALLAIVRKLPGSCPALDDVSPRTRPTPLGVRPPPGAAWLGTFLSEGILESAEPVPGMIRCHLAPRQLEARFKPAARDRLRQRRQTEPPAGCHEERHRQDQGGRCRGALFDPALEVSLHALFAARFPDATQAQALAPEPPPAYFAARCRRCSTRSLPMPRTA